MKKEIPQSSSLRKKAGPPDHIDGAYQVAHPKIKGYMFIVIASSLMEWDHVSISLHDKDGPVQRTPTWGEMCWIKDLFFDHEECVVQFHPPRSEYVNEQQWCLHLWRCHQEFPRPRPIYVGGKISEPTFKL